MNTDTINPTRIPNKALLCPSEILPGDRMPGGRVSAVFVDFLNRPAVVIFDDGSRWVRPTLVR